MQQKMKLVGYYVLQKEVAEQWNGKFNLTVRY